MCVVRFKLYNADLFLLESFVKFFTSEPNNSILTEICYSHLREYFNQQEMEECDFDYKWEIYDEDDILRLIEMQDKDKDKKR